MMMQIVGNPASSWELIAHASRTIVALGYHTISDTEPKNDLEEEIHAAVAWCAHFDSCMSLLLLRPRSLPPLAIHAASLTRTDLLNPLLVFENISMEMIPIHYGILQLTLDSNPKSSVLLKEEVAWLRKQMSNIYGLMEKVCCREVCICRVDRFRNVLTTFSVPSRIFCCIGSALSSGTFPR
jgi:hypothetical protein